jgi:hypothetical protein
MAGLLTGVVLITFAPVLATPYAFLDDYTVLQAFTPRGDPKGKARYWGLVTAFGRPAVFPLFELSYGVFERIEDLRYLRLVGLLGTGGLAWLLWKALDRAGLSPVASASAALLVCTMPPFQVYASWAVEAFLGPVAILSGCAVRSAELAHARISPMCRAGLLGLAVVLQTLALTIYQPVAMFFCVFLAITLFVPGEVGPQHPRRLLLPGAVLAAALVLAFLVYRVGVAMYGSSLSSARKNVTAEPWTKITWFVQAPLKDALNLLWWPSSGPLAILVAALLVTGLLMHFRGTVRERLLGLAIALGLVPLTYLPNLVAGESWSAYRTQAALSGLIVVYGVLAVHGLAARWITRRTLSWGLAVATACSCVLASINVVTYFVHPQALELAVLREQLRRADISQARIVRIRRARWQDSVAPRARYDEFGLPSTVAPWTPRAMVALLLREMGTDDRRFRIEVIGPEDPLLPGQGVVLVDMRALARFK